MACVFVGLSSFLLLIELITALTSWGTIEMQEALQPSLATLQERGFDVTMGELLAALRWIGLGSVLLLVAGMVFAAYATRGDRVSRVGTTVAAVLLGLLVLPFGLLGVLQAVFLLVAAASLWTPDARRWFDSRHEPPAEGAPEDQDVPASSWATPPAGNTAVIDAPAAPVRSAHRPRSVLAAGLVTVLGSSIVGGLCTLFVLIYTFARDEYVTVVRDGPFADWYSAGELETALQAAFWGCLALLPLALAGLAAGILLLARVKVGRVATLAVSWITAAAGVVLVPFGLLGTGAAVAVIILLHRDESRAWTAGAR